MGLKSFHRLLEASRRLLRRRPGRDAPKLQGPFGRAPKPLWRVHEPFRIRLTVQVLTGEQGRMSKASETVVLRRVQRTFSPKCLY